MTLFQENDFVSHSGITLSWKIDCDSLNDEDIETLAGIIGNRYGFKRVVGVPTGGDRLAEALKKYERPELWSTLIVDDVMTTGASMEQAKLEAVDSYPDLDLKDTFVMGIVLFSRIPAEDCPSWIRPLFQVWDLEDPAWLQKTIEKDMKSRKERR